MIYLPMAWDNSSGGGAFCLGERWGPFRGRMLHTSFGAASLFAIFVPFFRSLVGSIIPPREVAEVLAPETSTSEVVSSMGTGVRLKIWLSLDLIRGLTDQLDGSSVRP